MIRIERLPINDGSITSLFGLRNIKVGSTLYWWHNGIDFKAQIGTPVYAVSNGTVKVAKNNEGGYGLYVAIDHGYYGTLYAHLSRYVVAEDQEVKAGDLIGYSGESGAATGPHLHFEIRICEYKDFWDRCSCDSNVFMRCVDPMIYINEFSERANDLTVASAIEIVQKYAGLEQKTIDYIANDYKYGTDLITKLAKAIL